MGENRTTQEGKAVGNTPLGKCLRNWMIIIKWVL
jgi:hypothetical protein